MCSGTIIVYRGLTALLAASLCAAEPRGLLDGHAGWSGDAAYPCDDSKLCEPIATPRAQEDVYVFHTGGNASWQHYEWNQITTVRLRRGRPSD
jgi:hypothetical protein